MWTGRSQFPVVSSPGLHTLPREKFVSFSHQYQRRVEFWMRVKLLHMKQLNTALKPATSSRSFSILSSDSLWKMCSSGNKTRSVRPGGKYRSIRHTKISEIQTGNFGRMERAQVLFYIPHVRAVLKPVSIKQGLRTTDYGLVIKHGLGIKRGLSIMDWV